MILKIYYPNCETTKETLITSSIVGGLLYLLLIIYQPFGTSQFEHPYKYLLLFPYALIATFSFCMINVLLRRQHKNWTVGLEILKIFLIILFASILNYFFNSLYISKVELAFENFLYMFLYTAALGFPVAAIYIMARYIYLSKRMNTTVAANALQDESTLTAIGSIYAKESNIKLSIVPDHGNHHFEMEQEDFIYAEAIDNYCFIHFYKSGVIQKDIIRISLTRLSNQIQTDAIQRVHRSFIVNLKKVKKYKGNASGYKISLEDINQELMVSRSYIDAVLPLVKAFVIHP